MQLSIHRFHLGSPSVNFISALVITQFVLACYFRILPCVLGTIGHHGGWVGVSGGWIGESEFCFIWRILMIMWFSLFILIILYGRSSIICILILVYILRRTIGGVNILAGIGGDIISYASNNAASQLHQLRLQLLQLIDLARFVA